MSKLFKLKAWLSVADAAHYLTIAFCEEVTEADVLRFALDGHLQLSVNFVRNARARLGCIRLKNEISKNEFEIGFYFGSNSTDNKHLFFLYSDKQIITINGIWDLPMIGGERLDVEHAYQTLTGGPHVKHGMMDKCFIGDLQGHMYSLQAFDNNKYQLGVAASVDDSDYYPAIKLPQDSVLVVRTAALRDFERKLIETPKQDSEKPLTTTERNTLLTIICVMAKDGYGNDLSKPYPLAKEILKAGELLGIKISDDTIANKFKDAKKVLDEKSE